MARTRLVTPVVINSIYARSGMLDGLKAAKNERKKKPVIIIKEKKTALRYVMNISCFSKAAWGFFIG
jgi:hypothetical protein